MCLSGVSEPPELSGFGFRPDTVFQIKRTLLSTEVSSTTYDLSFSVACPRKRNAGGGQFA